MTLAHFLNGCPIFRRPLIVFRTPDGLAPTSGVNPPHLGGGLSHAASYRPILSDNNYRTIFSGEKCVLSDFVRQFRGQLSDTAHEPIFCRVEVRFD
jgi:hypothetical protein